MYNVLILGASYGSLLSTKILMAGHNVSLVCLPEESSLINSKGTIVRITRQGETTAEEICSKDMPGKLTAVTPDKAHPEDFDLVGLAMQEPQFRSQPVWYLLRRVAKIGKPCLSIMNMPPLAYLRRISTIDADSYLDCYTEPRVWDDFDPETVTLCSPDPQAFRPPDEALNILQVGLPTNFKAARLTNSEHNAVLDRLEKDIEAALYLGNSIPVKLRMHDSLFVPMAKWSMLLTGNYRAITADGPRSINEAVHHDFEKSREIYHWVDSLTQKLGASPKDQVPFEKYAKAATQLLKPSSAARAVFSGAHYIERVDKLVQKIGRSFGMINSTVDENVEMVDSYLVNNRGA